MEEFYLVLTWNENAQYWEPGLIIFKDFEEAQQHFWKQTEYKFPGLYKLIKVTNFETIEEVEIDKSDED